MGSDVSSKHRSMLNSVSQQVISKMLHVVKEDFGVSECEVFVYLYFPLQQPFRNIVLRWQSECKGGNVIKKLLSPGLRGQTLLQNRAQISNYCRQ